MAWATANLKQVRQEVIRRLYPNEDVLIGTASGGSTTSVIDVGAADGVTLESGMLTAQNYIGLFVYVAAVAAPKWGRVSAYDPASGTITLDRALGATAASQEYEIHYGIHPERLNQIIKDVARIGSKQAMDTIDEAVSINFDYQLLTEGVLAVVKPILAKRFPIGDPNRQMLTEEAQEHQMVWQDALDTYGYGTSWLAQPKDAVNNAG